MADAHDASYLSIGEVLGLLLEEFPDVTISKIRFLESQGLISPERTASGYRKFHEPDVELLRVILTEQRRNYLPLRVIKDRLETGEIDRTGEHLRIGDGPSGEQLRPGDDEALLDATPAEVPRSSVALHPASRAANRVTTPEPPARTNPEPADPQLLPGVLLDRAELCSMVGVTHDELDELERYGLVQPRISAGESTYDDHAVTIAKAATALLRAGIEARHLRNWRTAAEHEVSLYEQVVVPRIRQRSPEARAEALRQLRQLERAGTTLRAAMTRQALRHHFEG